MRLIDEIYTRCPFFGSRRIREMLRRQGYVVNRKRVISLMQQMGIACVYPGPHTSRPHPGHVIYPYLLRHRTITYANEVWASDITSIRMRRGWLYLVAIMDSCSRYVLSWEVAITLEVDFCIRALEGALLGATPHIFNTDQGAQFTSIAFVDVLKEHGIKVSMDGKGRAMDNAFVERLWRSLKYEEVYLNDYQNVREARESIGRYLTFYNEERPHQALDNRTPAEVYYGSSTKRYLKNGTLMKAK